MLIYANLVNKLQIEVPCNASLRPRKLELEKWWARKTADEQRFFGEETLILKSTSTCSTMWLLQRWHQKDELSKCIESKQKKERKGHKFYRHGNADFSHPIRLCRFCRCWSTQYGRLQGAATISCRRTDSCHRTSTVYEKHNFAAQHCPSRLAKKAQDTTGAHQKHLINSSGCFIHFIFCQPTKQVQNSINIPSLQQVWVSRQQFQLSSADWLYLIRSASLRGLKNHLGERMPSSRPWHYTRIYACTDLFIL